MAESMVTSSSVVMLGRQSLRLVSTKHHHFQNAMRHGQVIGFVGGVVLFHNTTSHKRDGLRHMPALAQVLVSALRRRHGVGLLVASLLDKGTLFGTLQDSHATAKLHNTALREVPSQSVAALLCVRAPLRARWVYAAGCYAKLPTLVRACQWSAFPVRCRALHATHCRPCGSRQAMADFCVSQGSRSGYRVCEAVCPLSAHPIPSASPSGWPAGPHPVSPRGGNFP